MMTRVARLAASIALLACCSAPARHLTVRGTDFYEDSTRFEWRGITAFRLAEQLAHGDERDVVSYLDWAVGRKLTVVRVLLMAKHLFELTPQDGVAALPRLLDLAAARGLYVEVVALADTADIRVDLETHVKAVGAVVSKHANALVEIANEPWHATQDRRLHDPAYVARLAELIPPGIPVALGSAEKDPGYAAGTYVTWHAPRLTGSEGWAHVIELAEGAQLLEKWRKPVISDEPIGAAPAAIPGRRDNAAARFGAAAALGRLAGMGSTFHYEGGLQARIASGAELECLDAWSAGLDLLADMPDGGTFTAAEGLRAIARAHGHRAVFGRVFDDTAWVLGIDPAAGASITPLEGWTAAGTGHGQGVRLYRLERR